MSDILTAVRIANPVLRNWLLYLPRHDWSDNWCRRWSLPGSYGLIIDALVSLTLATADGRLIEASKATNSDLFWAIRGAGANFGIITSATHNVHKLQNDGDVTNFDLIFPANMSPSFFKALESFNGTMPEKPLK